jgi:cytoskeletal protein RodZ
VRRFISKPINGRLALFGRIVLLLHTTGVTWIPHSPNAGKMRSMKMYITVLLAVSLGIRVLPMNAFASITEREKPTLSTESSDSSDPDSEDQSCPDEQSESRGESEPTEENSEAKEDVFLKRRNYLALVCGVLQLLWIDIKQHLTDNTSAIPIPPPEQA